MNVVIIIILLKVIKDGLTFANLCSHSPNHKFKSLVAPEVLHRQFFFAKCCRSQIISLLECQDVKAKFLDVIAQLHIGQFAIEILIKR